MARATPEAQRRRKHWPRHACSQDDAIPVPHCRQHACVQLHCTLHARMQAPVHACAQAAALSCRQPLFVVFCKQKCVCGSNSSDDAGSHVFVVLYRPAALIPVTETNCSQQCVCCASMACHWIFMTLH
eukprot:scaffold21651_cov24-Tisochrysis_lutea.AAC.1